MILGLLNVIHCDLRTGAGLTFDFIGFDMTVVDFSNTTIDFSDDGTISQGF